ncbi:MAG: sugar phosphate isomerase/epimerase family protein [Pirellulaceae bacterium]
MDRRTFLRTAGIAFGAATMSRLPTTHAGQFTGKIRKSLKWGMVAEAKKMSVVEAFRKLRECGFDGVEPSLSHVPDGDVDAWIAASKETGLIIDGTVGARTENLEPGIDLTKRLGGDSMLVVARYDIKAPLMEQWNRTRDQLKAAAPYAEKHGIKLLVENVWATFLISPFDMVRYIDEIGSPWVQVHFDIGNMMRWGVAEHWAAVLGKRSQKLDVKEYDLNKAMNEGMAKGFDVPLGEGSINWPAVREELAKINFQGWAAAEVRGGNWEYLTDVARRMDRVLDL